MTLRTITLTAAFAILATHAATAAEADRTIDTSAGKVTISTLATSLDHPWGMVFLPDGRLLVTERAGRLRIMSSNGALSEPLAGVPQVFARNQGGLLDVNLDPDFATNKVVWLSYAEPGGEGASTALARGTLGEGFPAQWDPKLGIHVT